MKQDAVYGYRFRTRDELGLPSVTAYDDIYVALVVGNEANDAGQRIVWVAAADVDRHPRLEAGPRLGLQNALVSDKEVLVKR